MFSRETVLSNVRDALGDIDRKGLVLPVLPASPFLLRVPNTDNLLGRFIDALESVQGDVCTCRKSEAAQKIREYAAKLNIYSSCFEIPEIKVGKPATTGAYGAGAAAVHTDFGIFALLRNDSDFGSFSTIKEDEIKDVQASVIFADFLLADSGSCVVKAASAYERMLCYLPPVCFVVASETSLRENLAAAWTEISKNVENSNTGEFLVVTGPSRTADIEKQLILGVHGPKKLIVFVVNS